MVGLNIGRSESEKIMVGDDVVIEVLEVRGRWVKLGVTAPSHVTIHRFEVWERIRKGLPKPPERRTA